MLESKPEIKADTQIMGLPAWSFVIGAVVYVAWNAQKHASAEHALQVKHEQLLGKIDALVAKVSEIERDEKDAIRHEIAELRKQLESK